MMLRIRKAIRTGPRLQQPPRLPQHQRRNVRRSIIGDGSPDGTAPMPRLAKASASAIDLSRAAMTRRLGGRRLAGVNRVIFVFSYRGENDGH